MAKSTRNPGSRQQKRPSKTIDLEANPTEKKSSGNASSTQSAAKGAESAKAGSPSSPETKPADPKAASKAAGQTTPKIQASASAATKPADNVSKDEPAKDKPAANPSVKSAEKASSGSGSDNKAPVGGKPEGKPEARKGGLLSMLVAALLGGGVALGGAAFLQSSGMIGGGGGASSDGAPDPVLSEIRTLAENAGTLAEEARNSVAGLGERMSELNQQILSGGDGGQVDTEAVRTALSSEIAAMNSRIDELAASIPEAGAPVAAADSGAVDALAERVGEIESRLDEISASDSVAEVQGRLDSLEGRLDEIATRLESLSGRTSDIEGLVKDQVAPQMAAVAKAAKAAQEGQRVARAISVRALTGVLEQGGSFANELSAAETLLGGSEKVDQLRPIAERGIRSQEALVAQFDTMANDVLETETTPDGEGLISKFMQSAKSLVKVRPSGPIEGDSPGAILSRMEAALGDGNLGEVVREWEGLPEAARSASSGWIDAVRDRMTAKQLIDEIVAELSAETPSQG